MKRIVFNGKFLSQSMSGVQRVAQSLIDATVKLKMGGAEELAGLDLLMASPPNSDELLCPGLARVGTSRLRGAAWEQLALPRIAGKDLLVNLCNSGPILRYNDLIMIHDAQVFISPQSYSSIFRIWYEKSLPMLADRAIRILTVSQYSRQCLIDYGVAPAGKIDVIHNGVDHILSAQPDVSILTDLELTSRPYFVAPSSLQAHKNIGVLIRAMASKEAADLRLVLIGGASGNDYEKLNLALPDNIVLAGRLPDASMRALIENASGFVFPSLTEGFGLPPLEAMLLGVPTIVAPRGAIPEVCLDHVAYADPEDPASWVREMQRIMQDNAWAQALALRGQNHAKSFTWSAAGRKFSKILKQASLS